MAYNDIIKKFPIGTPFSYRSELGTRVVYDWVTGLAFNNADELVFTVKWAHRQGEQMCHPASIKEVDYYVN